MFLYPPCCVHHDNGRERGSLAISEKSESDVTCGQVWLPTLPREVGVLQHPLACRKIKIGGGGGGGVKNK